MIGKFFPSLSWQMYSVFFLIFRMLNLMHCHQSLVFSHIFVFSFLIWEWSWIFILQGRVLRCLFLRWNFINRVWFRGDLLFFWKDFLFSISLFAWSRQLPIFASTGIFVYFKGFNAFLNWNFYFFCFFSFLTFDYDHGTLFNTKVLRISSVYILIIHIRFPVRLRLWQKSWYRPCTFHVLSIFVTYAFPK